MLIVKCCDFTGDWKLGLGRVSSLMRKADCRATWIPHIRPFSSASADKNGNQPTGKHFRLVTKYRTWPWVRYLCCAVRSSLPTYRAPGQSK